MIAPTPHISLRVRNVRSANRMNSTAVASTPSTKPVQDNATLAAWLPACRVFTMYGVKIPEVPAARFQNR